MVMKNMNWMSPVFILIWSSGFIVSRFGMPYSEPMTYLSLRFLGVCLLMVPLIFWKKIPWPSFSQTVHIAIAGCLIQFGYLGGVWTSVKADMPAGLSSLIVGLQPVLTAVIAYFLAERLSKIQWLGMVLGLVGVLLVLYAKLHTNGVTPFNILLNVLALFCITLGTIYQKKYCSNFDLRMGSFIQFMTSAILSSACALMFETREITWSHEMIGSLVWAILCISIGAMSLWFLLIRSGNATQVSSLMYLTPATTAFFAWIFFREPLTPFIIFGTLVTTLGVLLVNQTPKNKISLTL
jgi:drug/metabolite transporter (DMT)-like permease